MMRERLLNLMDETGLDALLLRGAANFAWYTRGGNSRVEHASPLGVADVVVTRERELVLTSTIEAPRMRAEETPGFEVLEYPWEEGPARSIERLVGSGRLGSDVGLEGALLVADRLDALRRVLDPEAVERLRGVGADLTAALEEAAGRVAPGMSEHEAAGAVADACRVRGLVPTVLLAATHERIARYRHALPTGAPLERRAMLVASAERGGLYANLTRMVWLDEPDPETTRRQAACDEILARTRAEVTRPGRTLAEAFAGIRSLYADVGFPDEWRLHHQGGITGYASRELLATPYTDVEIEPGMAFSWNPSITGAKSEETFILTAAGCETVAGAELATRA
jgi:Xaa-Pro dipeptidase